MNLVNDVGSILAALRMVANLLNKGTHIVNRTVRSCIQFKNIEALTVVERYAGFTRVAAFKIRGEVRAIDRFCQNPGTSGFANSPRTCKKKGLSELVGSDGVFQRRGYGGLPNHRVEGGWSVFAS